MQIFADVFQIPIEVSAASELGTMGAAMCAGIASGPFADFYQAVEAFAKVEYTCEPDTNKAKIYEEKFRLYQRLSRQMDESWRDWKTVFNPENL